MTLAHGSEQARSSKGPAFRIRLPELRLPELDFVEVYDQPPPPSSSRPSSADPPGYERYRRAFEQRASGGVQLPGSPDLSPDLDPDPRPSP